LTRTKVNSESGALESDLASIGLDDALMNELSRAEESSPA
jgi:uncharacterized membrane protein